MSIRQTIIDALSVFREVGLNAHIDPRNLSLPGVLISPDELQANTIDGNNDDLTLKVRLIAPDHGDVLDTLGALDELQQLAYSAIGPRNWRVVLVTLPNHSPDGLLALETEI